MARSANGFSWSSALIGAIAVLVLIAAAGILIVLGGAFDVAASTPHGPLMRTLLSATMDHSVELRARNIEPPAQPTAADFIEGAAHYKGMCQQCHGGPGASREEFAEGLNPSPPNLARSTGDMSPGEVFWIVKNGIKMTGMPAFGKTHTDEQIWKIAWFVKRKLPTATPAQYAAYPVEQEEGEMGDMTQGKKSGQ